MQRMLRDADAGATTAVAFLRMLKALY